MFSLEQQKKKKKKKTNGGVQRPALRSDSLRERRGADSFNKEKKKHLQLITRRTKDDVGLEQLLSELEMRLQLLGEDISLQLERESQLGVKRIPTAIGEIEVLEENVEFDEYGEEYFAIVGRDGVSVETKHRAVEENRRG